MGLLSQFFLAGLTMGASICAVHCSVLLFPVVARGSRDWKAGIRTGLLFGAGKTLVYGIFGGIASFSGYLIRDILGSGVFSTAAGVLLMIFGVWFFFYRGKCGRLFKSGSPFFLGLADGVFPCGPMMGFLVYIAYLGGTTGFGAAAGALFGLGTVSGPVLAVCGITPYIWRKALRLRGAELALRITGCAVFILWGILLIA